MMRFFGAVAILVAALFIARNVPLAPPPALPKLHSLAEGVPMPPPEVAHVLLTLGGRAMIYDIARKATLRWEAGAVRYTTLTGQERFWRGEPLISPTPYDRAALGAGVTLPEVE